MGRQKEYVVEQIRVEGLFLSLQGALKRAYLCEYAGYAVDAAEWTDTAAMTPALIADDVARVRQQLARADARELQEQHQDHLRIIMAQLRRRLLKRGGETRRDRHVSVLYYLIPRSFDRLFGRGLEVLARADRKNSGGVRRWRFATTASYYNACWPRTRLRLLAGTCSDGRKRILAVQARLLSGGELCFVLTAKKVFIPGVVPRIEDAVSEDYTIITRIEVRFSSRARHPRNNLRIRGARLELSAAGWRVATPYLGLL